MSKSKVAKLDSVARTRLSKHFFLRDFLFSEIAAVHGMNNMPNDIDLAVFVSLRSCSSTLLARSKEVTKSGLNIIILSRNYYKIIYIKFF